MDQHAGLFEFVALNAVKQRDSQQQLSGCAVVLPTIWLAFDEQNGRIDAADHASGDHFVQPVQLCDLQLESFAPDGLRTPCKVEEPNVDLDQSAASSDDAVYG